MLMSPRLGKRVGRDTSQQTFRVVLGTWTLRRYGRREYFMFGTRIRYWTLGVGERGAVNKIVSLTEWDPCRMTADAK